MTIKEYAIASAIKHPILRLKAENYQSATADAILFSEPKEEEKEEFVHVDLTMNNIWTGLEDLEFS